MAGRAPLRATAAGIIIAILAVVVLAADQFAKYLALTHLPLETPVHVLGDFLILYLIKNAGAAFSLGTGVTWIFTIALSLVAIGIVWLAATRVRSRAWAIILGLLLGGVLGNLTDRLFRAPGFPVGHVVDFISTPWMMPAIYNVADTFIVTMMIGVAILVLTGLRLDGTRERRPTASGDTRTGGSAASVSDAAEESAAANGSPTSVEGFGKDRDPLFPAADPDAGAPRDATATKSAGDESPSRG
ncbi:signal peptidase II [Microbacterium sp.]|uniref:signal peptidase II n=1 Tax=Microbacterium sp. TaxID=51671 RepID=UPI0025E71B29|nr:signal peptidase II [Microbacterium sp.]